MRRTATTGARVGRRVAPAGLLLLVLTAGVVGAVVLRAAPVTDGRVAAGSDGVVTRADGVLPDGVTVFAGEYPGVANLDPALLRAVRAAARDASGDGVVLHVNSGWRSPDYQEQLRREAVAAYGSAEEAARRVAPPETSPHVAGDAIDIGPVGAAAWLADRGARYGLCRVYRNEPWHFELRPSAVDHGCPRRYADPTRDPRLQQGRSGSGGGVRPARRAGRRRRRSPGPGCRGR